jgi:hypothetical protein
MTYLRRYFPALTITTPSYGDKSVTTDKIADKAVTTPKVAPGAVGSEEILDKGVKTEDLGDSSVITSKIADGAVTNPKIGSGAVTDDKCLDNSITGAKLKDGSVTPAKLSGTIAARPLTPGIETVEIKDGVVTAGKLAGDAVEEAKIKNGAVTTNKIAPSAVDNTRLAANAVHGTEIQDGAVSATKLGTKAVTTPKIDDDAVTTIKLDDDSVTTPKIDDDAVTSPKILDGAVTTSKIDDDAVTTAKADVAVLETRHQSSYRARKIDFFDEFCGVTIPSGWQRLFDAGGWLELDISGRGARLTTPATINKRAALSWGGVPFGTSITDNYPINMDVLKHSLSAATYIDLLVAFYKNMNNYIGFSAIDLAGAVPNLMAHCKAGGVLTKVDTGIAITTGAQMLTIEIVSAAEVKFYVDGILAATIATNIPSGVALSPFINFWTRENLAKDLFIRSVSIIGKKES